MVKYANYHWRQLEGANIDNALATIRQGRIKTTGLPKNKLLNYNREKINSNVKQLVLEQNSFGKVSKRNLHNVQKNDCNNCCNIQT
mgnify:CR=1 FL=1